jgi:DNA-binding response OmpR family regulator
LRVATVLLADDDADLRAVYSTCLRAAGYGLVEAADGREAIAQVRANRPDVLLLDLWMPGLSGFEVLDALRHEPAAARTKVIILSSQSDADARLEAFGGGAVDYLVKGVSLAELLGRIRQTLDEPGVEAGPTASP